jgi:integrase
MNRQALCTVKRGRAATPVAGSNGDNPQVSALSRFQDDVWDFSHENGNPARPSTAKKICWSVRMPNGGLFTDPQFRSLLTALKQFIYALRWHPIDAAPFAADTLPNIFLHTKRFVDHLVGYRFPVLRFKDVLPQHCEDYIQELLGARLSAGYKYHCLGALEKLAVYNPVMQDGLIIDPLKGKRAYEMVGYGHASRLETQTKIIPDEILRPLVQASLEYVERFADYLLDTCEAVEDIRNQNSGFERRSRRRVLEHAPAAYGLHGTKFENGLSSVSHLNRELCYLQTACLTLIAFATGMRVSEILSLQVGCCEIQKEPGQADLVWLRGRVFKMQGVPEGRSAKWLGGPRCARAVRVLERLGDRVRRRVGANYLWMPIPAVKKPRPKSPFVGESIRRRLKLFIAMLGLKDSTGRAFHIHPHMFRRTFARHVVRHDTTNLLALKEHFKHVSLSMTDYYVGSDPELWTLMVEEEDKLLFESFDAALRADQMAGPGGVRLKKKIDEAIEAGQLPREFRGEAGTHLRKEMIRDLVESGQRVYPCAASNYCWFRPESALCTQGNQPILKRCNPGACTNSIIAPEHKPHWEKVQRDCEELMKQKPQAEPYQKALRDIHAVSSKVLRDLT